jgi:membrane fusion protein (multidrug efflux system)
LAVALLVLLTLPVAFCGGGKSGEGQGSGGPPVVSVSASKAESRTWNKELTAIGTAEAVQGVDVTTEVAGIVSAIAFRNGASTDAGRTLIRLDTSTERAEQASLVARRDQARLAHQRAMRLIERGAISKAEVEEARAEWQNLAAQVRQVGTVIEKKRIDAPFSGALGIRRVSLGEFVSPGTPIVSLQQLRPIYINFPLPEDSFQQVREGLEVRLKGDAFPGSTFTGRITAINPEIAEQTRSFTVQATVPNRNRALRPGMFADVTVDLPGSREVVVVPTTAITRNAYGDIVYVVERLSPQEIARRREQQRKAGQEEGGFLSGLFGGSDDEDAGRREQGDSNGKGRGGKEQEPQLVAKSVFVEVGETRGLYTEIIKGIEPGARVVTAGQLKLEDGAPIRIMKRDALDGADAVPDTP